MTGCVLLLLASAGITAWGGRLENPQIPEALESGRAMALLDTELPGQPPSFSLIFSSPTLQATDSRFHEAVERALAPLRDEPSVTRIRTAYDAPMSAADLISRDGRRTIAVVELKGRSPAFASIEFAPVGSDVYPRLRSLVKSTELEVLPAGTLALNYDFNTVVQEDLQYAELIVLPGVLVLLLLVFGAGVAATLPLAVGLLAVASGVAGTLLLSRITPVSIYAANIITMIGLGVAIDYSLFFVSRFREELRQHDVPEALAFTTAAAGRVIVFSGATVAIGLLALLWLPVGGIASMGVAGTIVVAFAVFYGLTFLVAALAMLGHRVNAWRVPFVHPDRPANGTGFWHRLARVVMAHPWQVLIPVTIGLLLLGTPVFHIRLATGQAALLPATAESRRGEELLHREFPGRDLTPIILVVRYDSGAPLTAERVGELYDLSQRVHRLPNVTRIQSVVDLDPMIAREHYQLLLPMPIDALPPEVPAELAAGLKTIREHTIGARIATLLIETAAAPDSAEARRLVARIRRLPSPPGADMLVTGPTAFDLDFISIVERYSPVAVASVLVATYLVLFLLLGSVLLPLKAVVMNLLSITASYGALVWVFQDGHLARWLNFTPSPIEPITPLIMFCILFGLSMDYEVLLLSRTGEEYQRTRNNSQAVAASLEQTGRLITGAAAIMAAVFFGFGASRTVIVKAMGVGMGLAVIVDATIVRALLVPATMELLGRWNWWAPPSLRRLYVRLGLGESPEVGR
jgi:RND superfamily putative drug exporter